MSKLFLGILQRRSFRVDILSAFGALLIITFLVTILYNYRNTSRLVLMLGDDIMEQTTQAVIDRTMSFLQPPATLAEMSSKMVANGVLPFSELSRLERYAIECLQAHPQIAMFLIGDQAGNFLLSKPEGKGVTATKFVDRAINPPRTTWKYWNKDNRLFRTETLTTDTYDPRTRPWYQGAKDKKGVFWTDLFIYYTGSKPGIAVSFPIIDSKSKVIGVIGCDIELEQLSTFLQSLKIGKHGIAFIINNKKELVGYPDPAKVITPGVGNGKMRIGQVDELDNAGIVAAFQEYEKTGQEKFAIETAGVRYHASFTNFPPSFGKPWQVAIVVPEDDFIGVVKGINRRVLYICLFFLAIAVVLVFFISRRISRPILQLAKETDKVRKFQLDGHQEIKSRITEIQILGEAINRMKASLRSFMRFAPQQIVQEVVLAGKETMLGGERREVTLLFSDLRNFTRFAEKTRPEEVVHILNAHFDAMVRIIVEHGGYVVDFLGDSLFVVFGAPQNDPGHAWQAIRCAVNMQLTRAELNADLSSPQAHRLEMGVGINTGSCVVGNMGSHMRIKYGVVGHAVNLAARIETFTVGGQVLVSEATRRLAGDKVAVAGPLTAYGKGVEGAIQLWEVRGLRDDTALTLPPTVPGLKPLPSPLPVLFRLITGKQISLESHEALFVKLSLGGAELTTTLELGDFTPLQIQLQGPEKEQILVDAKVAAAGDQPQHYLIRFSGLEEKAVMTLEGMLSQGS